jgi:hypothetical protein
MNAPDIRRRRLLGSAVSALAVRPSRTAQADVTFTNFSFAATGAPTTRTMPDRLSDVINVKDWGAVGNNLTNDATAIQNAINYCISRGGGTVFFPSGNYVVRSGLVVGSGSDLGVRLVGSGKGNTYIFAGSLSGFVISKGGQTYDNLERIEGLGVVNQNTTVGTGAIKLTRDHTSVMDLHIKGMTGIDCSAAVGVHLQGLSIQGPNSNPAYTQPPGPLAGSVAIYGGTGTVVMGCRVVGGYDIGCAFSGSAGAGICLSIENERTAVRIGWRPNPRTGVGEEWPALGVTIQGMQTERCDIGIDLYNAEGCFIQGNALTGITGVPPWGGIRNMTWNVAGPNLVEVTTVEGHSLPAGTHTLQIDRATLPSGFIPPGRFNDGIVTGTVTAANKFTYPGVSSDPGTFTSSGGWGWPIKYDLRVRKAKECAIVGNGLGSAASIATVDLDYEGEATEHRNNAFVGAVGNYGWLMPSDHTNLAGWQFMMTGTTAAAALTFGSGYPNPLAKMVFADLPGQSGVYQPGPFEGQEYLITDSPTAASGNFAATVGSGGGSNHVKVRYDGSAWTISG